jgi:Ser/Thr protein kinase RdoA (MazF antagonist)
VRPSPSLACLSRFSATSIRDLSRGDNANWLVETPHGQFVLRGYARDTLPSVTYERSLLQRLAEFGWPVPSPVDEPFEADGRIWTLFSFLPGEPATENGPQAQRERGRLLARLHGVTARLTSLGQRPGFVRADALLNDPQLSETLRVYERQCPSPGHVLRWHFDKARELFANVDVEQLEPVVLHGDFTPWNIFYSGGQLSGIFDFEAAHLNFRASDFALSWRGYQDDVVAGYEELHPLSEAEQGAIVPAFWSWIFMGIRDVLAAKDPNALPTFEWEIKKLVLRSRRFNVVPYPGTQ